jgi:hypothetical protein
LQDRLEGYLPRRKIDLFEIARQEEKLTFLIRKTDGKVDLLLLYIFQDQGDE